MRADEALVRLRPWEPGDDGLLARLLGDPAMTEHIGGPETPERLAARHLRYLDPAGPGAVFAVTVGTDATPAGWVGYWESSWGGAAVWECGWSVLPEFQGRGVATAAMRLAIPRAMAEGLHDEIHAFPAVGNPASNAVCRKLGFELLGEADVEYPPGHVMRSNDWRLALGPALCPECGAPLDVGSTCREHFHALLALEAGVPGAAGGLPHFYAVASYGLQHPGSMGYASAALEGLRASVEDALAGHDDVAYLRRRAQAGASQLGGRVTRRGEEPAPGWGIARWSMTVADVIAGGPADYVENVAAWARSIVDTLAWSRV